jgi:hypothetical protein
VLEENGQTCLLEVYCQGVPNSNITNDNGVREVWYRWNVEDSAPNLEFVKKDRKLEKKN